MQVLRGRAREGVSPSLFFFGGGGGGSPENFEFYDTCRCILSHCPNIPVVIKLNMGHCLFLMTSSHCFDNKVRKYAFQFMRF